MSTKYTLRDLVSHGIVKSGDILGFTFKRHTFKAKLLDGGILGFCTFDDQTVFTNRPGFTSLTDWSDTCIQECLHEFVTRFSSWKRIRHEATGTPMFVLRSKLWEQRAAVRSSQNITETDLLNEKRRNVFLQQRIKELESQLHRAPTNERATILDDNPFKLEF